MQLFAGDSGTFEVQPRGAFRAGDPISFTTTYTAGVYGMDEIGGLRICMRLATDLPTPDFEHPGHPAYTTLECPDGVDANLSYEPMGGVRPWYRTFVIRFRNALKPGESVVLRYGDTRFGGNGLRMQTFCEESFNFLCLVDMFGTNKFQPCPAEQDIAVIPNEPVALRVHAPSTTKPGGACNIRVTAVDKWHNPCPVPKGRVSITDENGAALMKPVASDGATMPLDVMGYAPASEGFHRVTATLEESELTGTSNPVCCGAAAPRFWGDLHGQSEETVGTNSARSYFRFARDAACVDICSHQGNDFQITHAFWLHINKLTEQFDTPGTFLAVPGYEWSGNTHVGGDHNVYYRSEGEAIFRTHKALIADKSIPFTDAPRINDLFDKLRDKGDNVVVNAHVGGRHADLAVGDDPAIRKSVEIHSAWGTFEWLLHQAMDLDMVVGVVCASDDHHGRPGASYPGASLFGTTGGLTCYIMPRLNRDNLFNAMRCRHHYGTTGSRMFLDVSLSGRSPVFVRDEDGGDTYLAAPQAIMGDVVRTAETELTLDVRMAGTAPLQRIDLYDGTTLVESYRPNPASKEDRRVRVLWHGAECRGRKRTTVWDGSLKVTGNEITRMAPVNFHNPDTLPVLTPGGEVVWMSYTAGNFAGLDLWLKEPARGTISMATAQVDWSVALERLGDLDSIDLGGEGRMLTVCRMQETPEVRDLEHSYSISLSAKPRQRLYVCVTQEDGHRAWSSPIYLSRHPSDD